MKEKERRKRKSEKEDKEEKRKSNGCTLSFYNGYLIGDAFWPKKMLDAKGPLGGNLFKHPARYIFMYMK